MILMQRFDLTVRFRQYTTSANTQRAYYRWIDRYLHDVAGLKATRGEERLERMRNLPLRSVQKHLTPRKFKNWLNRLAENGQGRQGLDQARATMVTLAHLLAAEHIIDAQLASDIQAVRVPPVPRKASPERLLSADEIRRIMSAAREMATSPTQTLRNDVVAAMLCTMALRREELSVVRWGDLTLHNGAAMLKLGEHYVDIPRPVLSKIDRWRQVVQVPPAGTPLVRRIWKGGRVARAGLSPDGIWLIIRNASQHANLGHVTPDDLRRSAVANMVRNGMPIEEISRLLRHRNVMITERFITKLSINGDENK